MFTTTCHYINFQGYMNTHQTLLLGNAYLEKLGNRRLLVYFEIWKYLFCKVTHLDLTIVIHNHQIGLWIKDLLVSWGPKSKSVDY